MTTSILIKNNDSSLRAAIVHISNDASTRLLKPGETADVTLSQGMCVNLIESEENYTHGESTELPTGAVVSPAMADIPLEFKGE